MCQKVFNTVAGVSPLAFEDGFSIVDRLPSLISQKPKIIPNFTMYVSWSSLKAYHTQISYLNPFDQLGDTNAKLTQTCI